MKRSTALCAAPVVAGLVVALAACSSSSPTGPVTTTTTTLPPPQVTFVAEANPGADVIALDLASSTAAEFRLVLAAVDVADLYGYGLDITYDATLVAFEAVEAGTFLDGEGVTVTTQVVEPTPGTLVIGQTRVGAVPGVSGSGTLLSLDFRSVAAGSTAFTTTNAAAFDSTGTALATQFFGGTATVPAQAAR